MAPRTPLGRLLLSILLALSCGSMIVILATCKATFAPLDDDDDSSGDDDSAGDDDSGDDDSGDDDSGGPSLYDTGPLQMDELGIYSLYLLGAASGTPGPIEHRLLHDNLVSPTAGQPHLRFVNAAQGAGPVDIYLEDALWPELAGFQPGAIYPHPEQVGYGTISGGVNGTYKLEVYPAGATYGDGSMLCDLIATYTNDMYYTVVITGTAPDMWECTRVTDPLGSVAAGNFRLGVFHSIEDTPLIDVKMEAPSTIDLWNGLEVGNMGNAWEIPANTIELGIYESEPQ